MAKKLIKLLYSNMFTGIVTTIIGGLIVGVLLLRINSSYESNNEQKKKLTFLNEIRIGQSKEYIDDKLNAPIVYATLPNYSVEKNVSEGNYSNAGYKLENCVILCLYKNDSLAAFIVVVNKQGLYRIPTISSLSYTTNKKTLLDFTYAEAKDFRADIENFEDVQIGDPWLIGYATTLSAFCAYAEIHSGSKLELFNANIIGNYQYYPSIKYDEELYNLYNYGNIIMSYQKGEGLLGDDENALKNLMYMYQYIHDIRKERYPNLYGIVSFDLVSSFDFLSDIVQDSSRAELLFGDW